MRGRRNDAVKSAAAGKKASPAAAKAAAGRPMTPSSAGTKAEASPVGNSGSKRASSARSRKLKSVGGATIIAHNTKPETSVEMAKASDEATPVTKVAKAVPGTRVVRKVVRKVIKKVAVLDRNASGQTPGIMADAKANIEDTPMENAVKDSKTTEVGDEHTMDEKPLADFIKESVAAGKKIGNFGKHLKNREEKVAERKKDSLENNESMSDAELMVTCTASLEGKKSWETGVDEPKEEKEEQEKSKTQIFGITENSGDMLKPEDPSLEEDGNEKIEGISDQEVHEEFGGEDFAYDVSENEVEAETLDGELVELNAAAKEHKARKEREIFVGGLDRDAVEEDVKKVFRYAGEVVEIRMHMDPSTNKNKGFAFVQFATKEQASYALSEMKNPVINGKRCGTAPIEGDDTLFLGNICNTWTKEAIQQKLKDYGVEGVENITMVADPRNEGLSRGFVFIEFSCHAEAMLAYKKLQKPDVVFGHAERTAKVAFAEPQREPDPKIMAQVKSVFVDGLPPHWDEDRVRMKFKVYGEISKLLLARNMSTARRKDFGFVDFNTHEAALSCVEGVNNHGLNDGNTKVAVRARLSNPLPKMQAIKGGMCGGFRISHGRGYDRGVKPLNRANFQYPREFHSRGSGRGGRMGGLNENEFSIPPPLYGRLNPGRGERWGFRGGYQGPDPARAYPGRAKHDFSDRDHGHYESYRRLPYFKDGYDTSFMGRRFDELYPYDAVVHGIKRPYNMMDQDLDLAEPSHHRSRLDSSDPAVPIHRTRYRDDMGTEGSLFPQHYYDYGYVGRAYSAFNRGDRPYGRDYY